MYLARNPNLAHATIAVATCPPGLNSSAQKALYLHKVETHPPAAVCRWRSARFLKHRRSDSISPTFYKSWELRTNKWCAWRRDDPLSQPCPPESIQEWDSRRKPRGSSV